jgi:GntR family transcriptional regulator of vanillate catabolism
VLRQRWCQVLLRATIRPNGDHISKMTMATRGISVTTLLRDKVLNGEFGGRRRLNEVDLAQSLGVSRTPIRAALSTLSAEGLLSYTPNSGYVVRAFSAEEIEDVYEVRGTLEGLATRQAAERELQPQQAAKIDGILAEAAALAGQQDTEQLRCRFRELNDAFHSVVNDAARNDFLRRMVLTTRAIPLLERLKFEAYDNALLVRAHHDHVDIFDAIKRRQGARAEALAREHVWRGGVRVVEFLRTRAADGANGR